jgi:hypothetical protein
MTGPDAILLNSSELDELDELNINTKILTLKCAYKCRINNNFAYISIQQTNWGFIQAYAFDVDSKYLFKITDIFPSDDAYRKFTPAQMYPSIKMKFGDVDVNVINKYHICNHQIDSRYSQKNIAKYTILSKDQFDELYGEFTRSLLKDNAKNI